jgi:hypothetical protein
MLKTRLATFVVVAGLLIEPCEIVSVSLRQTGAPVQNVQRQKATTPHNEHLHQERDYAGVPSCGLFVSGSVGISSPAGQGPRVTVWNTSSDERYLYSD